MSRELGRAFAWALIVAGFVIPQVIDPSAIAVFGLGAGTVKALGIIQGAIGIALSLLPTAWKAQPT